MEKLENKVGDPQGWDWIPVIGLGTYLINGFMHPDYPVLSHEKLFYWVMEQAFSSTLAIAGTGALLNNYSLLERFKFF